MGFIPAIEGSIKNTGSARGSTVQDSGFSSFRNLEELEKKNQFSLMPDKRFESDSVAGTFSRSNFIYHKEGNYYICPANKRLDYVSSFKDKKGRLRYRYMNVSECAVCSYIGKCSKGEKKSISRDHNEEIAESMRNNLKKEENKKIYKKRAHCSECPTGHLKQNIKFKTVMRRGLDKIKMEMNLVFMLHNILKIGKKRYS